MAWFSAGPFANPTTDTILADTAGLNGNGSLKIIFAANITAVATIEQRNAANNANVNSQVVAVGPTDVLQVEIIGIPFAAGERLRIRLNATIVGSCQASIFTM